MKQNRSAWKHDNQKALPKAALIVQGMLWQTYAIGPTVHLPCTLAIPIDKLLYFFIKS